MMTYCRYYNSDVFVSIFYTTLLVSEHPEDDADFYEIIEVFL